MASLREIIPGSFVHLTNNSPVCYPIQNYFQQDQQKKQSKKIHKCKFTKEEDEKLCHLVKSFGENNWATISKNMENRNARQCRERWKNYMNPKLIKNEWTEEDDRFLLKKYQEIGPHWNKITQYFHNRSSNSVRNRFVKLNKAISTNDFNKFNQKHQSSFKIMPQNSFQASQFVQNNFIRYHQQFVNVPNNPFQKLHQKPKQVVDVDYSSTKKQSSKKIDIIKPKNPDVVSEKKDFFDIFWDSNEENDTLSSWASMYY